MSVVNHRKRRAFACHSLKASRRGCEFRKFSENGPGRNAEAQNNTRRLKKVRDIKAPEHGCFNFKAFTQPESVKSGTGMRRTDVSGRQHFAAFNLKCCVKRAGNRAHAARERLFNQPAPCGIVGIDDRAFQARPVKKQSLGFFIGLHRAVIIEMIPREVGEGRRMKGRSVKTALHKADGTRFNTKRLTAPAVKVTEEILGTGCVRRRERRRRDFLTHIKAPHRAHGCAGVMQR